MVKVIDATARILPEYQRADGLMRVGDLYRTKEENKELNDWLRIVWRELSGEVKKLTGKSLPRFSKKHFDWVQFEGDAHESRGGDHNPSTGQIRMNAQKVHDKRSIARVAAHEIFHMISQRKIAEKDGNLIPLRSGLSLIGNVLAGGGGAEYTFKRYSLSFLDEALVEIMSQRALNNVTKKTKIPGLEFAIFKPTSYSEPRRMYGALVNSLVLAWNDPSLRRLSNHKYNDYLTVDQETGKTLGDVLQSDVWIGRQKKLQDELGWSDTVTAKEVEAVFENALLDRHSITKISRLINTMLGDGVFRELFGRSAGMALDDDGTNSHHYIWKLISGPTREHAQRHKDVSMEVVGLPINISATEIPHSIPAQSYESANGHLMDIQEILTAYERIIEIAPSKKDILTIALIAHNNWSQAGVHTNHLDFEIASIDRGNSIITLEETGNGFCFQKLSQALGIDQTTIIDSSFLSRQGVTINATFYECKNYDRIQLARVSVSNKNGKNNRGSTIYLFVHK